MIRWVGVGLLAMAVVPAVAQRACVAGKAGRAATFAIRQQQKLLDFAVDEVETSVPPALRSRIGMYKDALADTVEATFECAPLSQTSAALQLQLATLLGGNQPEKPFVRSDDPSDKPVTGIFGDDLKIKVTTPANAPLIRTIELNFDIDCGVDSMLLVYESGPDGWRRRMRWQSGGYTKISEAFGDGFEYKVLPATAEQPMRIVAVHGRPWCTSRFSAFLIDVLEPSADRDGKPHVIWETERDYSRGDAEMRLSTTTDGFQFRTNVPAINFDEYERSVVFRFRIDGDRVQRVEPIAVNGRGFVDEWLNMPWEEAKGQTAPKALDAMKLAYERFVALNKGSDHVSYTLTHGPVLACVGGKEFQVEMDTKKTTYVEGIPGGHDEKLPATYFRIAETGNGYRMLSASEKPSPDCSGPDLMKKR